MVCQEAWFTLKKIEDTGNKPEIDVSSLPKTVRKAMEKFQAEDTFM